MLHCRLYKNGLVELPDGKVIPEDWLMERIYENIDGSYSREKIRNFFHLLYSCGSERGKYIIIGDKRNEQMKIEFVKEDLDTSKNLALNN